MQSIRASANRGAMRRRGAKRRIDHAHTPRREAPY
jgi:hypothetical protein